MTGAPVNNVPILKVEIDDADFKAFQHNYAQFQKQVDGLPGAWAKSDSVVATLQKRFEDMRDSASKQERSGHRTAGHAREAGESSEAITLSWADLYITMRRAGTGITGATRDLVKWERLTAVFAGLLGAGGLYGINRLTADVATRRMTAGGIGVSIGQSDAMRINYGRLGDTGAMLQGINEVRTSADKQPFQSLGVDSRGKNPAELFVEMLPRIKQIVDHADPTRLHGTMEPYHLERFGMNDAFFQRLREMPQSELDQLATSYRSDAQTLDIPADVAEAWQAFQIKVTGAGIQIQTVLADNLVNITPGLEDLSKALVHLFDALGKSEQTKQWLDKLSTGLTQFGATLDSDAVTNGVTGFMKQIDATKQDLDRINHWFEDHQNLLRYFAAAWSGAQLGRIGGGVGAAVGAGLAVGGLAAKDVTDPLNPQQTSEERTRNAARVARARTLNPSGSPSEDRLDRARPADAVQHAHDTSFLTERSRQELAGVNKDLADSLLSASEESGIRFQVTEGHRTQAEADANAAKGIGVSNSQHLYGAATDLKMIDPATGQPTMDRSVYERFAAAYNRINREKGNTQRWLGDSRGRWGRDIVHFDQGIGYGQSHTPDPYGDGPPAAPTASAALPADAHNSKPAARGVQMLEGVHRGGLGRSRHPNSKMNSAQDVTVIDNTGGASQVQVAH